MFLAVAAALASYGCDHYVLFVLGALGAAISGLGLLSFRNQHEIFGALLMAWGFMGLFSAVTCEIGGGNPHLLSRVVFETVALLIVKIAHPVFGDKMESVTGDVEIPAAASVGWKL